MPDLRKFCNCGGELVALDLTPQQVVDQLETWTQKHDGPTCYAVNAKAAKAARRKDFLNEIFDEEGK